MTTTRLKTICRREAQRQGLIWRGVRPRAGIRWQCGTACGSGCPSDGGACNDGCYREWRVYDPFGKTFPAGEWAALRNAWVASDGKAWVSNGTLWRPEVVAINDDDDRWLGGGWYDGL